MPKLEIKDNCLVITLGWFAGMFWPSRMISISKEDIERVYFDPKKPSCLICREPVANLLGLLSIGIFYPNGYSQKSELWWFSYKNKVCLNIVLKHGSHAKIVLGMTPGKAAEWMSKIEQIQ